MDIVRAFTNFPGLAEMQTFLASNDTPLETSELYSSEKDAKIVDPELRKSRFRAFQDPEIFALVNQLVGWLNESDPNYSYQLRRDNITETRYEAGGHFLKHKDFLSVTSNLLEEHTLLLCVTPPGLPKAVGGETLIFPYASKKGVPFDTTTPGNGLLFRKDLDHAGALLKKGEKHILTANLWATRKQASRQVLFVTFPGTADAAPESTAQSELQRAANQHTSYALPVDCLQGTMLEAHVRFVNQAHESQGLEEPIVVTYECTDFTFEEFGTVSKVLLRSYVDENLIRDHAACLDFFGPFANEKLLVNLALESKPADPEASCEKFVKPTNIKSPNRKKTKNDQPKSEAPDDLNLIVCENESRTKVVYEVAQKLGFDSYAPFKMIFVEGLVSTGYYESFEAVDVTPVVLVVGDYNHVFGIQKFEHTNKARTLKELHENHAFDVAGAPLFKDTGDGFDSEYDSDELFEENMEFTDKPRGLGLKVAMGDVAVREKLTSYVANCSTFSEGEIPEARDCFSLMSKFMSDSDQNNNTKDCEETKLFHRDENGKITFTEAEADAASSFLAAMDVDGRVKASLQEKRFELPQESKKYHEYYCNESTYANFNVLFVTGLVKLDSSIEKSFTGTPFDAWPTSSQKEKRSRRIRRDFREIGLPLPRGLDGDY